MLSLNKYKGADSELALVVSLLIPVPAPNLTAAAFLLDLFHCCYASVEALTVAETQRSEIAHME